MSRFTSQESKAFQRTCNVESLKWLVESGSDISKPHTIENFFHEIDPARIKSMIETLTQHGYQNIQSHQELDPRLQSMVIIADWTTVPGEETLGDMTDQGVDLAAAFGCVYDGWGTECVKSD